MRRGKGKGHSFRHYLNRLALPLLLALLVVIIVVLIDLSIDMTGPSFEAEMRRSAETGAQQVCNNLENRMLQIEDSAKTLLGTIYPYLNTETDIEGQLTQYTEMGRIIGSYIGRHMVEDARLYCPDDRVYARQQDTFFSLKDLESDEAYQSLTSRRRSGLFWQETRPLYQGLNTSGVRVIKNMISCVGLVMSKELYDQPVGVLYMDVLEESIAELLNVAENMTLLLVNDRGRILASRDESKIGTVFDGFDQVEIEKKSGSTMLEDEVLAFAKLENCGWYVLNCVSSVALSPANARMLRLMRVLMGVSVLLVLGIALLMLYWLSSSRAQRTIDRAIASLSEGQDALPARDSLTSSANQLALTAQRITEERYRDRLAIVEYQMKSLQSQIKPHFLYNTLDVIRWMILDGDAEGSAWMVSALSKYLRLSINKGPDIVTLREEVELTKSYLAIMQRRFRGKFHVDFDLDEETLDQRLPKFSLQPLTENAIIHGLLGGDQSDSRLMIRAWRENERTCIEIEDNGTGMDAQALDRLLHPASDAGDSGFGVANVRKRLMHFGCREEDFHITSQPGSGTCVTMVLPPEREQVV